MFEGLVLDEVAIFENRLENMNKSGTVRIFTLLLI